MVSLLYHDVVDDGSACPSGFAGAGAERYKLPLDQFAQHLRDIARSLDGRAPCLVQDLNAPDASGLCPVMITFDDGGSSAAATIAPALSERGWPAHFFVTTDRIGIRGFLGEGELRELAREGHSIGSHSCSHPARMSALGPEQLDAEWQGSVARLSDILGTAVTSGSIPGGFYSDAVARAAAQAGITTLFTSEPTTRAHRIETCRVLGRYTILRGTPARVAANLIVGKHFARQRQWVWWNAKKVLKNLGGTAYLRIREVLLASK